MTDSVSVIIPTYNVAATIERAIESALQQTHPPHEIICIDDCSKDNTLGVLESLASRHPEIRILKADRNRGPSHARNLGFDAATGEWIAILDGDDAWRPERLERMLAAAHAHAADVVFDNLILHDLAAGVDVRLGHTPEWDTLILDPATYWRNCVFGRFQFSLMQMLVRRASIESPRIRYLDDVRYGEDLIFNADLLQAGLRTVVLAEGYYVYTTRVGAVSGKRNTASQSSPDFIGIVQQIDRFTERQADRIDAATRQAILACRESVMTGHKANLARQRRRDGDILGYVRGIMAPDVLSQILRIRWRTFILDRRPG
jgi:succinoglycan biosynthesis protein ExoO